MPRQFALLALLLPVVAPAAERGVYPGTFDRIRVQGPYEVTVSVGASPTGTVTGEKAAIDRIEVRVDGTTLVVRPVIGSADQRAVRSREPVRVALTTPNIVSASVVGASRLKLGRMRGERIDLSISGTGAIEAAQVDTPRLIGTVIGSGSLTLAGKADNARLLSNGTGTIDAAALDTGELFVRLDGPGEIRARAHYQAQVSNTGVGRVSIAGTTKCRVVATAGGPVDCGSDTP
ncbi:GIN domain-containing protein [Sphingomonas aerophila]|jgi:hypothetical protein|uniref:Putative auto-transporter adhesin head GIN domain-containing protein n=1 Tax=Sphingomonas aerophila TaxID=1344948 RepID=A0A7W9BAU8_9SPHN|nr:DUF2807 domain-containing protein [Sphingomonas aerophila]MBB5713426.1 hypothetical protein [Sphingomonas aerophila]